MVSDDEDGLLRSVALQNAVSILQARNRAEEELVRAKEALRANAERLRAIFSQAAVGIAIAELNGQFADVNQKVSDILGYTLDELRHMTFADITHPEDLQETVTAVGSLLSGAIPDYAIEKRYVHKDGRIVWSLTTVTCLRGADGRPEQFIGVIEDITPRKRAQEELREETRILELLNRTGTMLASTLDVQALVQAVTDAGTELSGAQFGAFFYNTVNEEGEAFLLYTLSGAPREAFERFGLPRNTPVFNPTFRGEAVVRSADITKDPRYGTMAPHHGMPPGHLPVRSYLAVPVRSRGGNVLGGLFFGHPDVDVFTEKSERLVVGIAAQAAIAIDNARLYERAQKAAEERKALLESERLARSAAERMSEMKDEFLATLSHELRTPLNAILGWSQLLRQGMKDPAELARAIDTIQRNARVQAQLIDDLLDMSRINSGKLRIEVQPVRPAAFIDSAIETLRPAADAKGITIEKLVDLSAGTISGDPGRLQQVVCNVLSNAIKFTPHGGTIHLSLQHVDADVEIRIADTGVGIKPEFMPFLFERFRQADPSTTRRHGGLGLGLSIVKHLVELHGGTITVASPGEGGGTTVTIHLPSILVQRSGERTDEANEPALHSAPIETDLSGVTVLVVDDQEDARDLMRRVLEGCHARVVTASSAEEALMLVESERPDVLVSDIGMPEVDGFELLRNVRALGPERGGRTPAIAVTAFARSEDRTRTLRAGFLVHVSKPFEPSELLATVASVAGRIPL